MKSNLIVHLRVYKGNQLLYNSNGKVTNENSIYKVEYDSKMWEIAVIQKNLRNEYGVIELEKLLDNEGKEFKNEAIEKEIKQAVFNIHNGSDVPLTSEQKRIKELEEQIKEITKSIAKNETIEEVDSELEKLRVEYETLSGKKAHHKKTKEQLLEMIAEIKK